MPKIIGNTTTTPMAVPDLAQTDSTKANYTKNKKVSFLENDSGYATEHYVNSEISEVKAIAKGRATGYVFDTVDDMNTWLADSDNVANLTLGDNLYIRATDVPDYWWDGTQAQQLETQKVDLTEYMPLSGGAFTGEISFKDSNAINSKGDEKPRFILVMEGFANGGVVKYVSYEFLLGTIEAAITNHGMRIDDLESANGDIETALDNIIAIQNSLIGGGSV